MAETCYRHPDRETRVSCSSCGRPICPDCMTPTPVGMRCPECMNERTKVVRNPGGAPQAGFWGSPVTFVLIGINVALYLIGIAGGGGGINNPGGTIYYDLVLQGNAVANGDWYRIVGGGFLHANLLHIGFNMFLLYMLGRLLEPSLGSARFAVLYFAALLAGSFGALLLTDPATVTVGASGAVFGLFGAGFILARGRGMDALAGELGLLIVINLVFSFTARGISIGGHLGGLVAGLICGLAIVAGERGRLGPNHRQAELAVMILVAAVSAVGSIVVA